MAWHLPESFKFSQELTKQKLMWGSSCGDALVAKGPSWCPWWQPHKQARILLVSTPNVDGTGDKEGGRAEWVPGEQFHTTGLRRSGGWRGDPGVPALGGLQARLNSEAQHGFHTFSVFLYLLGWGQRGEKTTCFFINDAFCRVRLSTD